MTSPVVGSTRYTTSRVSSSSPRGCFRFRLYPYCRSRSWVGPTSVCQSKVPPGRTSGTWSPDRSFLSRHGTNPNTTIARSASLRNGT